MKNPLQALLIVLALGLCGLCTWQWHSQVLDRKEMTLLAQTNYDQTMAIQGYTNSINTLDQQVAQMDAHLTEVRATLASNVTVIATLNQDNNRLTSLVDQYSNTFLTVQVQIKQANDSILAQNESIKSLVAERDEYVKRLNDSLKERNDVVTQYNELVKRVEEMQAGQGKKQQK